MKILYIPIPIGDRRAWKGISSFQLVPGCQDKKSALMPSHTIHMQCTQLPKLHRSSQHHDFSNWQQWRWLRNFGGFKQSALEGCKALTHQIISMTTKTELDSFLSIVHADFDIKASSANACNVWHHLTATATSFVLELFAFDPCCLVAISLINAVPSQPFVH